MILVRFFTLAKAAQRYCAGNFTYWDSKITTPPGLYIYSTLIHRVVSPFSDIKCDELFLRITNLSLLPVFGLVFNNLNTFLYGSSPTERNLSLLTFPMLLFFSCFYYTDTISLLVVLVYLSLQIREAQVSYRTLPKTFEFGLNRPTALGIDRYR